MSRVTALEQTIEGVHSPRHLDLAIVTSAIGRCGGQCAVCPVSSCNNQRRSECLVEGLIVDCVEHISNAVSGHTSVSADMAACLDGSNLAAVFDISLRRRSVTVSCVCRLDTGSKVYTPAVNTVKVCEVCTSEGWSGVLMAPRLAW